MKNYKQFIAESVNISGSISGNVYINASSQQDSQEIGESYSADILWRGSIYRLDLTSKNGIPTNQDLTEQLQGEYPGSIVQQIYPDLEKNLNIKKVKRYHPAKLEWI